MRTRATRWLPIGAAAAVAAALFVAAPAAEAAPDHRHHARQHHRQHARQHARQHYRQDVRHHVRHHAPHAFRRGVYPYHYRPPIRYLPGHGPRCAASCICRQPGVSIHFSFGRPYYVLPPRPYVYRSYRSPYYCPY